MHISNVLLTDKTILEFYPLKTEKPAYFGLVHWPIFIEIKVSYKI